MTDMVERVAIAAWVRYCTPDDDGPDDEMDEGQTYRQYAEAQWNEWPEGCTHIGADGFRACARAVIEAMREPTPKMATEGELAILCRTLKYNDRAVVAWRHMIDAALSQSGEG